MQITFTINNTAAQVLAAVWGDDIDPTGQKALTAYLATIARDETLNRELQQINLARTQAQLAEEQAFGQKLNDEYPKVKINEDGTIEDAIVVAPK